MALPYVRGQKALIITLDAFGTMYKPRIPIERKYIEVAKGWGINGLAEKDVKRSFRDAFRETEDHFPHYGMPKGIGPVAWWHLVVHQTFRDLVGAQDMPDGLYHQLWDIYSSDKGYELYSDAEKLINLARKAREPPTRSNCLPQWHDVILGVLSNSDPRVNKVLKALGVKSKARYVKDETTSRRFPKVVEWEVIKFFSLSCYLGIGKPDPKVFRRTGDYVTKNFLSHMNSEDIVFAHIGDNYAKDGKGAFDAGWNGIYLNRNHAANRADVPPSTDMISRHEVKDDMQTSAIFEINNLEALLLNGKGEPAEHLTQAFAPLRKLLND